VQGAILQNKERELMYVIMVSTISFKILRKTFLIAKMMRLHFVAGALLQSLIYLFLVNFEMCQVSVRIIQARKSVYFS